MLPLAVVAVFAPGEPDALSAGESKHSMGLVKLIAVALLLGLPGAGNAGSGAFYSERLSLIREIHQLLIAKGLCVDVADCTRKQYAFAGPGLSGLNIYLYQVSDRDLLSDVIKQCALTVLGTPEMKWLELTVYAISKAEHLQKPPFAPTPHKSFKFEN